MPNYVNIRRFRATSRAGQTVFQRRVILESRWQNATHRRLTGRSTRDRVFRGAHVVSDAPMSSNVRRRHFFGNRTHGFVALSFLGIACPTARPTTCGRDEGSWPGVLEKIDFRPLDRPIDHTMIHTRHNSLADRRPHAEIVAQVSISLVPAR